MSEHAREEWSETVSPPMAPSEAEWARMTPADRHRVADSLPADLGVLPSEGTPHSDTVRHVRNALDDFYARSGRAVFIASNLAVYYPQEPAFAPDIMAVTDVGMHGRMRWLVSEEGRGLDLALEVLVAGDRRKDLERNVERYARLEIREYFVFDASRLRLYGYRLGATRRYETMIPQFGRLHSEVLGLELQLQGARLRFYVGTALVPEANERISTLEGMLASTEERLRSEAEQRDASALRLAEEVSLRVAAEARSAEEARLRAEEARLRAEAEARLATALAEVERLRGKV